MKNIIVFSLKEISKRWVFLITALIGLVSFLFIMIAQAFLFEDNFIAKESTSSLAITFNLLFMLPSYITISLLTIFSVYYVFKHDKNSTIEIFTRIAPISRKRVFSARLISHGLITLTIILTWTIISLLFSYFDSSASIGQRFNYSFSMLLGLIVTSLFFTGTSLFISIFIKGRILFSTNILIILALPFYSLVNEISFRKDFSPSNKYYSLTNKFNIDELYNLDERNGDASEDLRFKEYKPTTFNALTKFDIYNQLVNISHYGYKSDVNNRWYTLDSKNLNSEMKMVINGKEESFILRKDAIKSEAIEVSYSRMKIIIKNKDLLSEIAKHKVDLKKLSLEQTIEFVKILLTKATLKISNSEKYQITYNTINNKTESDLKISFASWLNLPIIKTLNYLIDNKIPMGNNSKYNIIDYVNNNNSSVIKIGNNMKLPIYKINKQIYYGWSITVLIIISLILIGSTWTIYCKRKKINW